MGLRAPVLLISMNKIYIISPRDKPPTNSVLVNTTSRSEDFGKTFSPMICQGPLTLAGLTSKNVENFWQGTKVYSEHINEPLKWLKWRDSLLQDSFAHRYPRGKGRRPEFSYLNKESGRLDYISARKIIYVPIYMQKLDKYCQRQISSLIDMLTVTNICFWDFDGRITDESFEQILNNADAKCGHAFVLKKYIYDKLGMEF